MKKFFIGLLGVLFCFVVVGCTNETQLRVAHISNITSGNSTNYAIKVELENDKRVEERYVDLQVKADKAEQFVSIGEENKEMRDVFFEKADFWYNLTYLTTGGDENEYQTYKEHGSKIFNLTTKSDVTLHFRVVAGKVKGKEEQKETILVLSEEISDELALSMKKNENN